MEFTVVALDKQGRAVTDLKEEESRREGMRPADARYERAWKMSPGVTHVRVMVRDKATGQHGTLDVPAPKAE